MGLGGRQMIKILIAEDEEPIANLIKMNLNRAGYKCTWAANGELAADYMMNEPFDLVLLDIMLPGINGYELMDYARQLELPVIFLTALGSTDDKVKGLKMGADDYLTKPFSSDELLARIRAMTRRGGDFTPNLLHFGNIALERQSFELSVGDRSQRLSSKEFQMLEMLMLHPNRLISTEQFMEKIWGYDSETEINVVWVYISYLRKKLTKLEANVEIKAVRNQGYSLEIFTR